VRVEVGYEPGMLRIFVLNDSGTPGRGRTAASFARSGGGHGIIGMRERVTMLGGELYAGREDGGFAVIAGLPMTEDMWVSES
jgi:signal transduction histidine kinase